MYNFNCYLLKNSLDKKILSIKRDLFFSTKSNYLKPLKYRVSLWGAVMVRDIVYSSYQVCKTI